MHKIDRKKLIICIAIPLVTGGLSGLLTKNSMSHFEQLNQPALSPPSWLFPVVWTILYTLMGIASYLVLVSDKPRRQVNSALILYGVQLIVNFLWPILFFNLGLYLIALLWLLLLLALVIAVSIRFFKISHTAGYLFIPYILWLIFAAYLNIGIYMLNR